MDGSFDARASAWDTGWDGDSDGGWDAAAEIFPDLIGFGSLVCALSAATEDEWTLDLLIRESLEALALSN